MKAASVALCALVLAGCEVGPDYHKPDIQTPASFQELPATAHDAPLSAPHATQADLSQWWMQIDDPELHKLIAQALQSNLDLLTADSRVREAREQEIIAGAPGLPQVNANGLAAKVHSNSSLISKLMGGGSSGGGSGAAPSGGSTDINLYSIGFDATWELDIFGGVRRGVEAAQANTEAAQWEMRDGEVSLTAEIANDYLSLRATQARIAILQAEYKADEDTLNLVAARARAGFVTQLDVNQQESLAASAAAEVPELEAQVRASEHAIAVLMGRQPEALTAELDAAAPLPAIPATLPVGLPSDLLRRRPDVREAERKLAAATAQEGVAVADLYPKFNLIGALSIASNQLGGLLSTNNLSEIGAGQIMWPIFHGGEIHANIRAKHEEEQQAYFAYQQAVLKAVQDAEDALVRYEKEQRRFLALQKAASFSRSSVALSLQQYRVGLVTYVNVLSAQSNYQSAQDQLAQSQAAFAQDLVSLYKALGGGWNDSEPPPPPQ